jgi:hypothetical protein
MTTLVRHARESASVNETTIRGIRGMTVLAGAKRSQLEVGTKRARREANGIAIPMMAAGGDQLRM